MVCCTAGNNIDLVERIKICSVPSEFFKGDRLLAARNALTHRIAHRLGLIVNLLEHEVLVSALLCSLGIPRDLKDFL